MLLGYIRSWSADGVEEQVPLRVPRQVAPALAIQAAMGDLGEVFRTWFPGIAVGVKDARQEKGESSDARP